MPNEKSNKNKTDMIFKDKRNEIIFNCLKNLTNISIEKKIDYIIISTENHIFTNSYQNLLFKSTINEAAYYNCDILCGGLADFNNAVVITPSLIWVDRFINSNYLIVFNKFFQQMKEITPLQTINNLNDLTVNKMVVFPFISSHNTLIAQSSTDKEILVDAIKMRENRASQKLELYIKGFRRFNN